MSEKPEKEKPKQIEIYVNSKVVVVDDKEQTGIEIKQKAIAQGVNIQIDFILFQDLNNGQQVIVKDEQVIKVHNKMRFDAITNDDNS